MKATLEILLQHESYWKRKHTIATNKLRKVRAQINELAIELDKKVSKKCH